MSIFSYQGRMVLNHREGLNDQHFMEESDTAMYPIGLKVELDDGRIYRYAKAGAVALAAGKLTVNADEDANVNLAVSAAVAAGQTVVTPTLGATVTANQLKDTFMVVNDEAGQGTQYKIKSHPAASAAATCAFTLYDPIKVALTTSSEVSLHANPWNGVVISVTDQADFCTGVPNIAVTANYYFWCQTGGTCAVLADEAVTKGLPLTIGTGVAGAVEALDAAGEVLIGTAHQALVDTEYRAATLQID